MALSEAQRDVLRAKYRRNTFNRDTAASDATEVIVAARVEADDMRQRIMNARAKGDDDLERECTVKLRSARRREVGALTSLLMLDGMPEHDAVTRATRIADGKAAAGRKRAFRGIRRGRR